MIVVWSEKGWSEFCHWIDNDLKTVEKIVSLVEDIRRSPFKGLGKPEPLRGDLSGFWSRRIAHEHRLVYRVIGKGPEQRVEIAQCRSHY